MGPFGELGVTGVPSGGGDFGKGASGFGNGHDVVVFAVEDPQGKALELGSLTFGHAAADGDGGGEALGFAHDPVPGAVTAHGCTGEVDAGGVDGVGFEEFIEQGHHIGEGRGGLGCEGMVGRSPGSGVSPHFARWALGGEDETGVFCLGFGARPDACAEGGVAASELGEVVAAFAGAAV